MTATPMTVTVIPMHASLPDPGDDTIVVDFSPGGRPSASVRVLRGDAGEGAYLECLREALLSGQNIEIRYPAGEADAAEKAEALRGSLEHLSRPSYPRIISTVDVVVLTFHEGQLQVGLTRREKYPHIGMAALSGGFIHLDEDASTMDAASRIARACGVTDCHLEQVLTLAGPGRDIRGQNGWAMSVVHLAVIHADDMRATSLTFRPVSDVPALAFDHGVMLGKAVERFAGKSCYSSLMARAMPRTFLMNDMIAAYRAVTGAHIDQASFRRKVTDLEMLRQVGTAPGSGKPAILSLNAPELVVYPKPFV